MRLSDLSVRLRRERVIFALSVALQDIREPASTMEIARMIQVRLECPASELPMLGRIIVSLAPGVPQARQASETFKRYGKEMRPWVWSPKKSADPVATEVDKLRRAGLNPDGTKIWTE